MKQYRCGFSSEGVLSFLLAMLPNILWALIPPVNDVLSINRIDFPLWDVIASVSQWLMIAALVLLVRRGVKKEQRSRATLLCAAACLIGYYVCWALYYTGIANPLLFVAMAVLPAAYFVLAALRLKNHIALVPAALFGAIHIALTCVAHL